MRIPSLAALLILISASAFAQTPRAAGGSTNSSAGKNVASLPHDHHEGLTISADPYTNVARAKEKFGKANPIEAGFLPVEIFIRNETPQIIKIKIDTIQLDVHFANGSQQEIDWLGPEAVANIIAHPGGSRTPQTRRLPIPLPRNDKKADKLAEILRPLTLDADVVPPMGMIHGFLYFNVNHDLSLAASSSLYAPDAVVLPANKPLMFFEVPLGTSE
ncbi:MAG: hypothetical protein WB780_18085 [Candidatus Acidiferrales bacterium]